MISANDKISTRQFQILTILNILGTSLMLLPKAVGLYAMEDSSLSVIIGILLGLTSTILICFSVKKQPYKNFYELVKNMFGKQLGFLISLSLIFTIIIITGINVKIFGEVFADVMLPTTPTPIISIAILLICMYGASKGLEARGRLAEIIIYFVFIFLILAVFFMVGNFDYNNFLPIMKNSYIDTFKGGLVVFFGLSGIIYIYLVYPFVDNKKQFTKSAVSAVSVIGLIMLVIVIITQGTFGINAVNSMNWPLLELISSVETNGSFVERQDALVISFWIFIIFASINAGIYYSSFLMHCINPKIKIKYYMLGTVIIILGESMLSLGEEYLIYLLLFFMVVLPLFITLSVKKVGVNSIILLLLISQSGCQDKISLENRSFPLTIGIDKIEDEFHLTYSIPLSIQPSESKKVTKESTGKTLEIAIKNMDKNSAKKIDYKHVKSIIFGKDFLNDEDMMKEVLKKINESPLNNKTLILGSDLTSKEVIKSQESTEEVLGQYISSYYKGNSSFYNMELLEVSEKLKNSVVVIPKISVDDNDEIKLQDGIILKDYKYVDTMEDNYTIGYMTFMGMSDDLTLDNGGRIINNKSDIEFRLNETTLIVVANIKVVSDKFYGNMEKEILEVWNYFYEDLKIDGLNIMETLRKKNYDLYQKRNLIENIELDLRLDFITK